MLQKYSITAFSIFSIFGILTVMVGSYIESLHHLQEGGEVVGGEVGGAEVDQVQHGGQLLVGHAGKEDHRVAEASLIARKTREDPDAVRNNINGCEAKKS